MTDRNVSLSVSIVTYRTDPNVLAGALDSLTGGKLKKSIYIVDNSPSDDLRSLATHHRAVYIHTGGNLGFGRAHNVALRQIQTNSKYHLILNPDVSFGPSVLDDLFELMEVNPGIGWVMPQVLYPNGVSQDLCKRLPAPWDLAVRRIASNLTWPFFLHIQRRYTCKDVDLTQPCMIPNLSGCFAFVRTELLQQIGGFDERFFLYLEDTDLVRRVGELSLTVYYPRAHVYHACARGSYHSLKLLAYHSVSAVRYFCKWGWLLDRRRGEANRSIAPIEPVFALHEQQFGRYDAGVIDTVSVG